MPEFGTVDEKRVFAPGPLPGPLNSRGVRIGIPICEDMWFPHVTQCLAETGAEILVVPNGSPFELEKDDIRLSLAVPRVSENGMPLVYLERVGGLDAIVFRSEERRVGKEC